MINIKPIIYSELKKVASNVSDSYPADWIHFPIIQYIEEDNSTREKTDDKEQKAYIRFKIDIWNNKSTSDIATAVDDVLSNLGFKRSQCLDVPEPTQIKHKLMRFEAVIDVEELRIYNP